MSAPAKPIPGDPLQGPLIRHKSAAAARLAFVLNHAACELWDASALEDAAWMWEEARAIASRILAACTMDLPEPPKT